MATTHHTPGGGDATAPAEPISPTRIIPAGQPLPDPEPGWDSEPGPPARESWSRYRPGATPLDGAPESADDVPPWRRESPDEIPRSEEDGGTTDGSEGAPAPRETSPETPGAHRPPPPVAPEITLRLAPEDSLTLQQIRDALVPVEARPSFRARAWRLLARCRPWVTAIGCGLAVAPITGNSSLGTLWADVVHYGRTDGGVGIGYGLAGFGILVAAGANWGTHKLLPLVIARTLAATAFIGLAGALHWWHIIQALTGVPL